MPYGCPIYRQYGHHGRSTECAYCKDKGDMMKRNLIFLFMFYLIALFSVQYHAHAVVQSRCEVALKKIFGNEGGFQKDRDDSGNWTGGKVGSGRLVGTKYGICAASYPKVDIPNLTISEAARYYVRDYWQPLGLEKIKSQWLATMFMDTAVNCGTGVSAILIARTINSLNGTEADTPADPVLTGKEIDWVNDYTQTRWFGDSKDKSRRELFGSVFREKRAMRYVSIVRHDPKKLKYLPTWLERTYE